MSRALDYLLAARPEAMRPYFAFLKASGGSLDPRTRALISVLSKVHARTPAGFRQYLKRALAAGVTPDEVLDALLAAFPMLGLTRIVWAVDQLLELDLPEFRLERLGADAPWQRLGPLAALPQGGSRHTCAGRALLVYRAGATLAVYDARCPHQGTVLPAPAPDATQLTCPAHGWVFDLVSGACLSGGSGALRALAHRIEAGEVQVRL